MTKRWTRTQWQTEFSPVKFSNRTYDLPHLRLRILSVAGDLVGPFAGNRRGLSEDAVEVVDAATKGGKGTSQTRRKNIVWLAGLTPNNKHIQRKRGDSKTAFGLKQWQAAQAIVPTTQCFSAHTAHHGNAPVSSQTLFQVTAVPLYCTKEGGETKQRLAWNRGVPMASRVRHKALIGC